MSEFSDRFATVSADFTARVQGCPPSAWSAPSPCEGWTARDVASHVITVHRGVVAALDSTEAAEPTADEDILAAYKAASGAVQAALADPAKAAQTIPGPAGDMPFEQMVGQLMSADTLVHTWDLARATGQDERLNAEAVAAAHSFLQPLDEGLRSPGGFGPKIEPPAGADEQTGLLCFLGRQA